MQTLNWDSYKDWLKAKYSKQHAQVLFRFAKRNHCFLNPSEAAKISSLPLRHQNYTMQAMSSLSKYLGTYEDWQKTRKNVGLRWNSESPANFLKSFLSEKSIDVLPWLKETLPVLKLQHRIPMVFCALTGLRPSEAFQSCRKIVELGNQGKLNEYYNAELNLLLHFQYPQFLRRTKNAFLSFASFRLISTVTRINNPVNYRAFQDYCFRRFIEIRGKDLRSYWATLMKKHIDRELIDILQGRSNPKDIFTHHYWRPIIKEIRDKTLAAVRPLEDELLSLI